MAFQQKYLRSFESDDLRELVFDSNLSDEEDDFEKDRPSTSRFSNLLNMTSIYYYEDVLVVEDLTNESDNESRPVEYI